MSKAQSQKIPTTRKLTGSDRELIALARTLKDSTIMEAQQIRTQSNVFDLDTRDYVTVVKVGNFTPPADAQEVLTRIGNDHKKMLEILTNGLRQHELEKLREDSSVAWQQEDEEGNLVPFTGSTISEEKGKQLAANVLNMAKMLFGYAKDMIPGNAEENRKAKSEAKAKAQDMLLSQPAVLEALKGAAASK